MQDGRRPLRLCPLANPQSRLAFESPSLMGMPQYSEEAAVVEEEQGTTKVSGTTLFFSSFPPLTLHFPPDNSSDRATLSIPSFVRTDIKCPLRGSCPHHASKLVR